MSFLTHAKNSRIDRLIVRVIQANQLQRLIVYVDFHSFFGQQLDAKTTE